MRSDTHHLLISCKALTREAKPITWVIPHAEDAKTWYVSGCEVVMLTLSESVLGSLTWRVKPLLLT